MANGGQHLSLVMPTVRAELNAAVNVLTAVAAIGTRRLIVPGSLEEPEAGDAATSPYRAAKRGLARLMRLFHALYSRPWPRARILIR
jgi:UDP-glucose 4-epimerase